MGTPRHGRHGQMLLDMSATPGSGTPAIVPMMVDWSINRNVDEIDVTSCDNETNKEFVYGFDDWELSVNGVTDADSDVLFTGCDGESRLMYLYHDRKHANSRYDYGFVRGSLSETGGANDALRWQGTFKAASDITRVFI